MRFALRQTSVGISVGLLHLGLIFALALTPFNRRSPPPPPESLRVSLIAIPQALPATYPATATRPPGRRAHRTRPDHSDNLSASEAQASITLTPTLGEATPEISVDLEFVRLEARHLARAALGQPFTEPLGPPPKVASDPLQEAIERSRNAACKDKFTGAGLLGIPMLIADSLRDDGCIW